MVDLQSEQDERGQRVLTCVLFPQQSLDDANNSIGVCMCVCVCLYLCMCLSVLHVCTYKFTVVKCGVNVSVAVWVYAVPEIRFRNWSDIFGLEDSYFLVQWLPIKNVNLSDQNEFCLIKY